MAKVGVPRQTSSRLSCCATRPCWALGVLALLSFCSVAKCVAAGQPGSATEYQVKATYLFDFARFVEWPANNAAAHSDAFAICVLGEDPFGTALDSVISGEAIDGKRVVSKRISSPQEALGCRILFISSSEDSRLKETLAVLEKASVLTVSDLPNFSQRGGMIQFVLDQRKVRFEVNVGKATEAGLTLSSDLLKVAVAVRGNSQPGE